MLNRLTSERRWWPLAIAFAVLLLMSGSAEAG
jgi:hypothetical protein